LNHLIEDSLAENALFDERKRGLLNAEIL